ncbi:WD domain, G-beta repeat [Thalassoglobus neptunius]|uniref:WD domain, G-beta repeat n=1 Tax=Thalassoglobus neptunius TaxID=1938619 RepID=A0A5C5X6B3_9PLAN|nr:hypothetical protein [Thalassoglobus neptunius]TWT57881.1 WD domain, G-beta repeat [Thalassoglobus neptunius]
MLRLTLLLILLHPHQVLEATEPPVTSIVFSPDQTKLVTGSQRGVTIRTLDDLEIEEEVAVPFSAVHALAFSPDRKFLAIAGGNPGESGQIQLLNWSTRQLENLIRPHEDSIYDICWSLDSQTIASASMDRKIALSHVELVKPGQLLDGHSKGVLCVRFVDRDQLLVSAGIDQNLRVWNPAEQSLVRSLNNHRKTVTGLSVRHETSGLPMIASISEDRTVRFWQPTIGRMVRFLQLEDPPIAIQWRPGHDSIITVTASGRVFEVDSMTTNTLFEKQVDLSWCTSLAVHPNGQTIYLGGQNGQLRTVTLPETDSD